MTRNQAQDIQISNIVTRNKTQDIHISNIITRNKAQETRHKKQGTRYTDIKHCNKKQDTRFTDIKHFNKKQDIQISKTVTVTRNKTQETLTELNLCVQTIPTISTPRLTCGHRSGYRARKSVHRTMLPQILR